MWPWALREGGRKRFNAPVEENPKERCPLGVSSPAPSFPEPLLGWGKG